MWQQCPTGSNHAAASEGRGLSKKFVSCGSRTQPETALPSAKQQPGGGGDCLDAAPVNLWSECRVQDFTGQLT
ncbi:unnamed protein product [Nezara viridula]|uniref:Uncharacterized protein n=1 Tax=Nezara viridula TaxID=85310 RepID=A0A9P0H772_NEZVI|nr:unnamed protein product [Nezara viridula]